MTMQHNNINNNIICALLLVLTHKTNNNQSKLINSQLHRMNLFYSLIFIYLFYLGYTSLSRNLFGILFYFSWKYNYGVCPPESQLRPRLTPASLFCVAALRKSRRLVHRPPTVKLDEGCITAGMDGPGGKRTRPTPGISLNSNLHPLDSGKSSVNSPLLLRIVLRAEPTCHPV